MLIDKLAYKSKLRSENPFVKLIFALLCIAVCIWADSYVISAVIFALMLSLIIFIGGTSAKEVWRLLTVPASFIVIGAAAIAISINGEDMYFSVKVFNAAIGIGRNGLHTAIRVTAKCLGSISCMYFLSLTTPMTELFGVLRKSIIPDFIVEITELVYRYIFVLYDAAERIHAAQTSRLGYATLKNGYRSTGLLAANLFMRAYYQADRTYTAMEARGYDGAINLAEDEHEIRPSVCIIAAAVVALLAVLAIVCKKYGV